MKKYFNIFFTLLCMTTIITSIHSFPSETPQQNISTRLLQEVKNGNTEMVKILLKGHADPNVYDNTGNTPLHYAAMSNNAYMVSLLVQFGANPLRENFEKKKPRHLCNNNETIFSLLNDRERNLVQEMLPLNKRTLNANKPKMNCSPAALLKAIENGDYQEVATLLENNVGPNFRDDEGNTPLHYAVRKQRNDLVLLLLDHNANPLLMNNEQQTPLNLARERLPSVSFLLNKKEEGILEEYLRTQKGMRYDES